ncbi:carboxypeptidase Y-deficient [Coemansia biformis]|uniref:Carboxypeptidase Y-deficient n=1 Tax=Coemansia biformis TaxID=1286918 RepID=A0A9W7YF83_9FUNG|nr:carboxypeptidase Y-deficient [Coemansia biformis]
MRRSTVSLGALQTPAAAGLRANSMSGDDAGPDVARDSLRCPICGAMAPSLFALNVHLDDMHFAGDGGPRHHMPHGAEETAGHSGHAGFAPAAGLAAEGVRSRYASQDDLEEVKGAILGFFRGAGKAVRGLSGSAPSGSPSATSSDHGNEDTHAQAPHDGGWRVGDKDGADRDLVTRAHWQQHRPGARCSVPACGLVLTPHTDALNCRCCGRLMCGRHCDRQVRLSATAQLARRGGVYCRACDECHTRAAGGTAGQTRDLTRGFVHLRRRAVNTAVLEGNRIEKRLEKLALVHGAAQPSAGPSTSAAAASALVLGAQPGARSRALQAAEQEVVAWEDDALAASCPFCGKAFGRLASRRHHCRLCGRVVCGRAGCSTLLAVPLPAAGGQGFSPSRCADIRACCECERTVIRHRNRLARAVPQAPDLVRLYAQIRASMALVEEILPVFNALAMRLRNLDEGRAGAMPDLPRAARVRKQLTAAFGDMDQASKRIAMLPAGTPSSSRLHEAVRRAVAQYLQLHMFPLTMLPRAPHRPLGTRSPDLVPRAPRPQHVHPAPGSSGEPTESPTGSIPSSTSTVNAHGARLPPIDGGSGSAGGSARGSIESSTADCSGSPVPGPATGGGGNGEGGGKPGMAVALANGVGGAATGIASSLLSLVAAPRRRARDEGADRDRLIQQALAADPEKEQRIAAMPLNEKMASLGVLRDQRQRVLGYIGDAQRGRRLEDAASLQASLDDLDVELSLIERSL